MYDHEPIDPEPETGWPGVTKMTRKQCAAVARDAWLNEGLEWFKTQVHDNGKDEWREAMCRGVSLAYAEAWRKWAKEPA